MAAVRFSEVRVGGRVFNRYEFDSLEELEEFFLHHVVTAEGKLSSKVIGNVLLIWDREA